MAKIKIKNRKNIQLPKTTKIKSIVGEEYLNDYNTRFQMVDQIRRENHRALIMARDIILPPNLSEKDTTLNNIEPLYKPEDNNKNNILQKKKIKRKK